jgi:hypothetical protein
MSLRRHVYRHPPWTYLLNVLDVSIAEILVTDTPYDGFAFEGAVLLH